MSHYTAVGGGPTHGEDRYDYVYLWDRRPRHRVLTLRATVAAHRAELDHDAVVARFRMQGRAT
ncbi:MAG: hypothetical protein R2731_08225 [Nocardioides sp.]